MICGVYFLDSLVEYWFIFFYCIGVYIFFGVVIEFRVFNEFIFDWKELGVFFN